jgi:hypothetical protein
VSDDRNVESLGELANLFEMGRTDGLWGMRCYRRDDQGIPFPPRNKRFAGFEGLPPRFLLSGAGKIENMSSPSTARMPARLVSSAIASSKLVHIDVACRTSANHFGQSQPCSCDDKLTRNVPCLGGKM